MKHACLALLLLALWAFSVAANDLPAFHNVSGVAEDDVLNIRAAPGTAASIIGTLSATDRFIEVVEKDDSGDWARINTAERSGWVAMRYLARRANQPADTLPRPLSCAGTEPFWSLSLKRDPSAELRNLGEEPRLFTNLYSVNSSNRQDRYAIFGQEKDDDGVLTAVFHRAICTDGMSDRAYGISLDVFLTDETGVQFLSGCCSLSR